MSVHGEGEAARHAQQKPSEETAPAKSGSFIQLRLCPGERAASVGRRAAEPAAHLPAALAAAPAQQGSCPSVCCCQGPPCSTERCAALPMTAPGTGRAGSGGVTAPGGVGGGREAATKPLDALNPPPCPSIQQHSSGCCTPARPCRLHHAPGAACPHPHWALSLTCAPPRTICSNS